MASPGSRQMISDAIVHMCGCCLMLFPGSSRVAIVDQISPLQLKEHRHSAAATLSVDVVNQYQRDASHFFKSSHLDGIANHTEIDEVAKLLPFLWTRCRPPLSP
jgi:hypothetical protein